MVSNAIVDDGDGGDWAVACLVEPFGVIRVVLPEFVTFAFSSCVAPLLESVNAVAFTPSSKLSSS